MYLLKMVIFHSYVNLPEGSYGINLQRVLWCSYGIHYGITMVFPTNLGNKPYKYGEMGAFNILNRLDGYLNPLVSWEKSWKQYWSSSKRCQFFVD